MKDREKIVRRINSLLSSTGSSITKYYRNYALYNQTSVADFRTVNPIAPGVIQEGMKLNGDYPAINIIKSCVESVVSSIVTAKPRPYVNTIKGSYKTVKIAQQLQIFFDYLFSEESVYLKNCNALRDACVFDTGYVYIDEINLSVINVRPWSVFTDPNERVKQQVYLTFNNSSVDDLPAFVEKELTENEKDLLHINYGVYYNVKLGKKALTINGSVRKIYDFKSKKIPVIRICYTEPISSDHCLSIADMLLGLQKEINILSRTIALAAKKNPAQTILLQNASNIAVGELNNEIGNVIQYNSETGNGGSPVSVVTPAFISDQYDAIRSKDIEMAYNLVGKSQLSASGKKEAGVDSGVAIATLADLQSERFQVLLNNFINMFTEEAKLIMELGMDDETLITPSRYELKLTWKNVREDFLKMRIEFSSIDSLSKDPSERLKQLQALANAGIIPATQISALLEIPDINRGFSAANNGYNCAMTIIDACIYDDKYDVPYYISFTLLKELIVNAMLNLRSAEGSTDSNEEDIAKLSKLFYIVIGKEKELDPLQQEVEATAVTNNNAYKETKMPAVENNIASPYDTSMSGNSNVSAGTDTMGLT